MNLKHLRKRIMSNSEFTINILDDKVEVLCECLGFTSLTESYPILENKQVKIDDKIKHHLVGLLIRQTGFLSKLQQIENRIKNLNELV